MEQQLISEQSQDENTEKLIRFEQFKISQARGKIARIQEEWEAAESGKPSLYAVGEAREKVARLRKAIADSEKETERLRERMRAVGTGLNDVEAMRRELEVLRDKNLDNATFEEKLDVIAKLGIRVYPSEDLKSMRVMCQLNLEQLKSDKQIREPNQVKSQANGECESTTECRKVMFGSPSHSIDRTPDIIFKALFAFT